MVILNLELPSFDIPLSSPSEKIVAPEICKHEVTYVTSHKGPSLVAAFSNDGQSLLCPSYPPDSMPRPQVALLPLAQEITPSRCLTWTA